MCLVRAVRAAGVTAVLAGSALAALVLAGPVPVLAGPVPVLAGPVPAAAAGSGPDVVPTLSSTPFGAPPGQRVTHTIALSATGAGTWQAVRVTFTTTVALDGVTATASAGSCPIVTPLTVVCDLGNLDFSGASDAASGTPEPTVTITGTVHPGTAPGALVQNLVNITAGAPDADPSNNVTSNAYLVAGGSAAPVEPPPSGPPLAQPAATRAGAHGARPIVVVATLVLAGLVAAALVIVVRRRRPVPLPDDDGERDV